MFTSGTADATTKLKQLNVEIVRSEYGARDLSAVLAELGRREIQSVLVEGGGVLAGAFFDAGLVIFLPIILTVDLGLPTRFLHMLMVPKPSLEIGMDAITIGPFHVKPFSPMNMGAWALLGFSGLAFLAASRMCSSAWMALYLSVNDSCDPGRSAFLSRSLA